MSKSSLPPGWEDRNNQMSEHDMKLGGVAATKFASKAVNAYSEGDDLYKTSDEVRDFYLKKQDYPGIAVNESDNNGVPEFWEERQRTRALEEKQYGVFASKNKNKNKNVDDNLNVSAKKHNNKEQEIYSPQAALVKVTTNSLETLALTFEHNPSLQVPAQDRAALAIAMKRAMDALSQSA
mmetsp:Transcript_15720/g.23815  ORF Transcript_15720/g.23815 Transcript_15720/m.23815 type:complete len:180 (+) Transcript_15720:136-675(+)|eukprot:CAMPEP_0178919946 /NCGR_PEP_ID=MMETSP0786-20121207/14724_1 /TAXON_ID=186022 /ORGANISM="Thalassionema frauenfeldii, Strain CCMP 1798" /LENGTH=179 /DNA_ID=CAMNT_0020593943 /DNA_START=61 /DNA_END=600 /DNA_ORIENTATION=-